MFSFLALRLLAAALAASPSPSPAPSLPPQITHVTTSDRTDETLGNTVRTTYVVTAADIARNGYRTIASAIANVPGVQISSYGPIGSAADYGIRGTSSTQTLVLIDGIPAPGGLADSVQLGTMSTAGVARIEIVEGGGSTLYGEGAIGGIINIITEANRAPDSATLSYGTFDDQEIRLHADGISFEHINADNTYALPVVAGDPATRADTAYNENLARYGLDRTLGGVGVSLRASLGDDNLGADGQFPDYSPTSQEHDVNENLGLTFSLRSAHSAQTATLFGTRQLITFSCMESIDTNCHQALPSLDAESRSGVDLRNVVAGSAERFIYGADVSRGDVSVNDGNGDPVAADALSQTAAYAQQTWTGVRTEFYAGVRGERDGSLGGEFSPSAGARYSLGGGLSLKINAATAFRAPNATELYFPDYGNPALHPERAQVGDATLIDGRLLGGTSIGWFDNDTRDLIVENPADNYEPENVGHAHIAGLTVETQTVPYNGVRFTLNATDLYLAEDLDDGTRLPDDPVFIVNAGVRWDGSPRALLTEVGLSERAVGSRGAIDPTQPLFSQPIPYSNLTAYARFRVAPRATLTVRGENLGNERYAEIPGYPMPGRTLRVELSSIVPQQR